MSGAIHDFVRNAKGLERENLKFLLTSAASELIDIDSKVSPIRDWKSFEQTLSMISALRRDSLNTPPSGVLWQGRPKTLTDELLTFALDEAKDSRERAQQFGNQFQITAGPAAEPIRLTIDVNAFFPTAGSRVKSTGFSNYAYYDQQGMGTVPHLDSSEYPVNAVLTLEHEYDDTPAAFVIVGHDGVFRKYITRPGELVIFEGESFLHYREPIGISEKLTIIAIGFSAAGEEGASL